MDSNIPTSIGFGFRPRPQYALTHVDMFHAKHKTLHIKMNLTYKAQELAKGNWVTIKASGASMMPRIKPGEVITLEPITLAAVAKGDIVLARVRGRYYIHLVSAVGSDGRVQIGNASGHVNGWTKAVYGRVI